MKSPIADIKKVLSENLPTFGNPDRRDVDVYDVDGAIRDYEEGGLDEEGTVKLFQHLLDTGMIYHLQGAYQRHAQDLINSGRIFPKSCFEATTTGSVPSPIVKPLKGKDGQGKRKKGIREEIDSYLAECDDDLPNATAKPKVSGEGAVKFARQKFKGGLNKQIVLDQPIRKGVKVKIG